MRPRPVSVLLLGLTLAGLSLAVSAQEAENAFKNRLFTTPAEREELDALRRRAGEVPKRRVLVKKKVAPPPPMPRVQVQGLVLRSDGPATAWVNDSNTLKGGRIEGGLRVRAEEGGAAQVVLPNRKSVALRPGETYDPESGRTSGIRIQKTQ